MKLNQTRTAVELVYRKTVEWIYLRELVCVLVYIGAVAIMAIRPDAGRRLLRQAHRATRRPGLQLRIERHLVTARDEQSNALSSRWRDQSLHEHLARRLLILKPPKANGEKGVAYVMFSEVIQALPTIFDMTSLLTQYTLILEPSWSGYCEEGLLQYTNYRERVYVLSREPLDLGFVRRLNSNLQAIELGSGDWVNPDIAQPYLGANKQYDIVMNALWVPWKRHRLLFSALRAMRGTPRVLLIGQPWEGCTRYDIEALAEYYGVHQQVELYENIPYAEVMEKTCQAKVGALLTLKEGANRAVSEMVFCDLPILVLDETVGGAQAKVNSHTGLLSSRRDLPQNLSHLLRNHHRYSPRQWAMDNISCHVSTRVLNTRLREDARTDGRPWTQDILVHESSPELKVTSQEQAAAEWKSSFLDNHRN